MEQDRQHLDEMQVEMKLAREFYLVVRLKNEKTRNRLFASLHHRGIPAQERPACPQSRARVSSAFLRSILKENTTSERMEDYDGQRFLEG